MYFNILRYKVSQNIQNGEKQCGWYAKSQFQAQLSSEFIQGLTCDTGATTTTTGITTTTLSPAEWISQQQNFQGEDAVTGL